MVMKAGSLLHLIGSVLCGKQSGSQLDGCWKKLFPRTYGSELSFRLRGMLCLIMQQIAEDMVVTVYGDELVHKPLVAFCFHASVRTESGTGSC
jgi:hypothetical protein